MINFKLYCRRVRSENILSRNSFKNQLRWKQKLITPTSWVTLGDIIQSGVHLPYIKPWQVEGVFTNMLVLSQWRSSRVMWVNFWIMSFFCIIIFNFITSVQSHSRWKSIENTCTKSLASAKYGISHVYRSRVGCANQCTKGHRTCFNADHDTGKHSHRSDHVWPRYNHCKLHGLSTHRLCVVSNRWCGSFIAVETKDPLFTRCTVDETNPRHRPVIHSEHVESHRAPL